MWVAVAQIFEPLSAASKSISRKRYWNWRKDSSLAISVWHAGSPSGVLANVPIICPPLFKSTLSATRKIKDFLGTFEPKNLRSSKNNLCFSVSFLNQELKWNNELYSLSWNYDLWIWINVLWKVHLFLSDCATRKSLVYYHESVLVQFPSSCMPETGGWVGRGAGQDECEGKHMEQ